jgi:hypothetical protein
VHQSFNQLKGKEDQIGPFKYSYNELVNKGVLVDSEVPVRLRKKTFFFLSSREPGVFDLTARVFSSSSFILILVIFPLDYWGDC